VGNYFGTYSRTLDEKGRLQIPSKLADKDTKRFFILKGFEGCLAVYEEENFNALVAKLHGMNFLDETARNFIRLTTSSVQVLDVDSHGRVLLSKQTLDDYRIAKDVTLIGVLDHFEIWDATSYGPLPTPERRELRDPGGKESLNVDPHPRLAP